MLVGLELEYPEDEDKKPILKNTRLTLIENFSADQLGKGINDMIDDDAVICTDEWTSYPNAVGDRLHLSEPSEQGKNFRELHWHIFNLKNWIRGIHHKVSEYHAQQYLNEFCYRFNSRNYLRSNPQNILKRMTNSPWLPYSQAKAA